MKELVYNYFDNMTEIIYLDNDWIANHIMKLANQHGYSLTQQELTDLVHVVMTEY